MIEEQDKYREICIQYMWLKNAFLESVDIKGYFDEEYENNMFVIEISTINSIVCI